MTLPMPHEKLEAPRSAHPIRRRPCRRAAVLQQTIAAATGTRMEMLSSTSLATWRPPHWRPIHSVDPMASSAAAEQTNAKECRRAARSRGFITASSKRDEPITVALRNRAPCTRPSLGCDRGGHQLDEINSDRDVEPMVARLPVRFEAELDHQAACSRRPPLSR